MLRVVILVFLAKMAACKDMEVHEKYLTMDRKAFIEYFNNQNFSWKITEYNRTFYYGSHHTLIEDNELPRECNVLLKDLPANFDARQKWPECETIKEINKQGDCGSCWTFGAGNTASDRTCIHKQIHVHLAEQDFECCKEKVCDGGYPSLAFQFWQNKGLVSNKCKPYDIQKLKQSKCGLECVDKHISYNADKHFAEKVYKLDENIDCIKSELVQNGPIQAAFLVFEDFQDYRGGIYEHKYGLSKGGHSVRVVGYGVEGDKEFWLVANSWGHRWGENGYFRIKTNQPSVQFESNMWAELVSTSHKANDCPTLYLDLRTTASRQ